MFCSIRPGFVSAHHRRIASALPFGTRSSDPSRKFFVERPPAFAIISVARRLQAIARERVSRELRRFGSVAACVANPTLRNVRHERLRAMGCGAARYTYGCARRAAAESFGVDVEFVSQYRELVRLLLAPRSGAEH